MISGTEKTLASIADGDYRSAGKVGIQTLIIGIATVITLGEGAAALAGGKGAGGAGALAKGEALGGKEVVNHTKTTAGRFGSGRPSHQADIAVVRNGEVVIRAKLTSGQMTAEEAALRFPRSTLATHTEARAVRSIPLQVGDTMIIRGEYAPCTPCKGAMNKAAAESGATIIYQWEGMTWIANGGKK